MWGAHSDGVLPDLRLWCFIWLADHGICTWHLNGRFCRSSKAQCHPACATVHNTDAYCRVVRSPMNLVAKRCREQADHAVVAFVVTRFRTTTTTARRSYCLRLCLHVKGGRINVRQDTPGGVNDTVAVFHQVSEGLCQC